jgi:DNA polymerase kappa
MLIKLEKEIPGMKLRLLGLRCSNLVTTKKTGLNFFGFTAQPKPPTVEPPEPTKEREIGAEEAFEAAARQEVQDEMNDLEQLSQEAAIPDQSIPTIEAGPEAGPVEESPAQWECPICSKPQMADDRGFNDHVDFCLSRQTIREATQDTHSVIDEPSQGTGSRKRKPVNPGGNEDPRQKRLFFR